MSRSFIGRNPGSVGKMTFIVINALAQFERDLLIERTQSGLARAKASGKPTKRGDNLSHRPPI